MNLQEGRNEIKKVMTVKDWLIFHLLMMIPIVNIIMWIKWLISDKTNLNLKNFLISSLVILLIWIVILIFIAFIAVAIEGKI